MTKKYSKKKWNKKPATIIVVDDEPNIHDMFDLLLGEKYNTRCFNCGLDGYDYIKNNEVDLVFIDYCMPELNGLETALMIKKHNPLIPVVMITAQDSEDIPIGALRIGIEDYLKKPFSKEEIERIAARFIPDELNSLSARLEIAKSALETEFSNPQFQLGKAAAAAGLNQNYLSWRFKQRYHVSPVQYLIRLRINKAAKLLENTNLNISQIARISGFNHHAYFCRLFSRMKGFAPPGLSSETHRKIP